MVGIDFRDQAIYAYLNGRNVGKFEEFKTTFYKLNGWDPASGWPKASTLESLGLDNAAKELETAGKLGS